jgi:hypothetical protein
MTRKKMRKKEMKQVARRVNSPRRGKSPVKVVALPLKNEENVEKSILKKKGSAKKSAKAKVHFEKPKIFATGDKANPVVIDSPEKGGNKIDKEEEELSTKTMVPKMSGFLLEPYFDDNKIISEQSINKLKDGFWVSTELLDFLIKYGFPFPAITDEEIIVPTSAIHNLLTVYLRNADKDKAWYENKKTDYQKYSIKPATLIIISCNDSNFLVIKIEFDPINTSGNIFKSIAIYDSLKQSSRNQNKEVSASSTEGMCLMRYQSFLAKYVLYGTSMGKKLINKFILSDI